MKLEQEPEGGEAAQDVLREIGTIDAQHEQLGPVGKKQLLLLEHCGVVGQGVELGDVDADRMRGDKRPVAAMYDGRGNLVDLCPEHVCARAEKVSPPAIRVQPDDVVRED